MKLQPYKSCNCAGCRSTDSKVRKLHKKLAHRRFRRQKGEDILVISTGYKI